MREPAAIAQQRDAQRATCREEPRDAGGAAPARRSRASEADVCDAGARSDAPRPPEVV